MIESWALWGLFTSAFISSTIAPGGSEAVLALMVSENQHPLEWLIMVATIGNTLGALTTWGLGLLTAKKYSVDKVFDPRKKKSIDWVKKYGIWSLFFSWLPVVGDGLCFAGGWLKLPIIISVIVIFLGKLVRYTFVAYLFI